MTPPTWRALAARARRLGLVLVRGEHTTSVLHPIGRGCTEELLRMASFAQHYDLILRTAVAAALEQLEARR